MTYDRPFWPPGSEIAAQAFDAFEAWRREHDPDGEIGILELVQAYGELTREDR